jgi:hypothetical protein
MRVGLAADDSQPFEKGEIDLVVLYLVRPFWPLEFGDPEFPGNLQAAASPAGFILVLAQEHFGLDAVDVGFVGEVVSARYREGSKSK